MMSFAKPFFFCLVGCSAESASLMQMGIDSHGEISSDSEISSDLLQYINREIKAQVRDEVSQMKEQEFLFDDANVTVDALVEAAMSEGEESGTPSFHYLLVESSGLANMLLTNTASFRSSVSRRRVVYSTWLAPGGAQDGMVAQLLESARKHVGFSDLPSDVSLYWTLVVRMARRNSQSQFHNEMKNLSPGVQSIVVRTPARWMSQSVTSWGEKKTRKVLVY